MQKFLTNSVVFLSDGQELYCANNSEEIKEELETHHLVKLILSDQNGQELSVHEQHIRHYESFDG